MDKFAQACYDKDTTKALELYQKDYRKSIFNLNFIEFLDYVEIEDKTFIFIYLNSILSNIYKEETLNYLFNKVKLLKLNYNHIERLINFTIKNGKSKQIKETEEILNNNNYNDKIQIRFWDLNELYKFINQGLGHNINDINDTFNFIDKYTTILKDDDEKIKMYKDTIYKLIQSNNIFNLIIPEELIEYTRFLVFEEYILKEYNIDKYLCKSNKLLEIAKWLKVNNVKLDLKVLYYVCIDNCSEDILNFIIENYTKKEILDNINSLLNIFDSDNELNIYCYSQEQNIIKLLDRLIKYSDNDQTIIHSLRETTELRRQPLPYLYYYLYDLDNNKKIRKYNILSDHHELKDSFLCSMENMKQVLNYNKLEKERINYALCQAIKNKDVEWVKWLMKTFDLSKNNIGIYNYNLLEELIKKYNLKGTNLYLSDFM